MGQKQKPHGDKISAKHKTDKGQVSKTYKELKNK